MPKSCTFESCSNANFARGYCAGHAAQLRKGQELKPLRQRRPAHLDDAAWCSSCQKYQPFSEFSWDLTREDWQRVCRESKNAKQRSTGKVRARANQYYTDNADRIQIYQNARKYGLTSEQYLDLRDKHGLCCAICGVTENENGRKLSVDHCHETGRLRGLLCLRCNTGIGNFKDNIELLEQAISYLRSGGPLLSLGLTVDQEVF